MANYTRAQKKAYYSGMGYRAAYEGKQIPFKNPENKESFRAGYRAKGKTIAKYPSLDSLKKEQTKQITAKKASPKKRSSAPRKKAVKQLAVVPYVCADNDGEVIFFQ